MSNKRGRADDKSVQKTNTFIFARRLHLCEEVHFIIVKREEAFKLSRNSSIVISNNELVNRVEI